MARTRISPRRLGVALCLLGALLPPLAVAQDSVEPTCSTLVRGGGLPPNAAKGTYSGIHGDRIEYLLWHDLCYADEVRWDEWIKPSDWSLGYRRLVQRFDLFLPKRALTARVPLVIYAHPSGQSEDLRPEDPHFEALVGQALAAGYGLASVEFRHPVASFVDPRSTSGRPQATNDPVPGDDIANAVRFMRYMAADLQIQPANIFLAGQSRGSLALMNALQNSAPLADSGWKAQSAAVRAVAAYQAQTTYREHEVAVTFIVERDIRDKPRRLWFMQDYPDVKGDPGSAASLAADPNRPLVPIRLSYDQTVTLDSGQIKLQCYQSGNKNRSKLGYEPSTPPECLRPLETVFDIHDPNYGHLLLTAYRQRSAEHLITLCTGIGKDNVAAGFAKYIAFFDKHKLGAVVGPEPPCP